MPFVCCAGAGDSDGDTVEVPSVAEAWNNCRADPAGHAAQRLLRMAIYRMQVACAFRLCMPCAPGGTSNCKHAKASRMRPGCIACAAILRDIVHSCRASSGLTLPLVPVPSRQRAVNSRRLPYGATYLLLIFF